MCSNLIKKVWYIHSNLLDILFSVFCIKLISWGLETSFMVHHKLSIESTKFFLVDWDEKIYIWFANIRFLRTKIDILIQADFQPKLKITFKTLPTHWFSEKKWRDLLFTPYSSSNSLLRSSYSLSWMYIVTKTILKINNTKWNKLSCMWLFG